MKLPSDLAGVNVLTYKSNRTDSNLDAATGPACTRIRREIRDLGLSETRVIQRLASATTIFEGVSDHVERLIYLMARSRVLELEVIHKQFGGILPSSFTEKLVEDLLKAETEPGRGQA